MKDETWSAYLASIVINICKIWAYLDQYSWISYFDCIQQKFTAKYKRTLTIIFSTHSSLWKLPLNIVVLEMCTYCHVKFETIRTKFPRVRWFIRIRDYRVTSLEHLSNHDVWHANHTILNSMRLSSCFYWIIEAWFHYINTISTYSFWLYIIHI